MPSNMLRSLDGQYVKQKVIRETLCMLTDQPFEKILIRHTVQKKLFLGILKTHLGMLKRIESSVIFYK